MPKTLNDYRKYLFGLLVLGAPLSFLPSIATPLLNFPSFRIGLYQVLAAVFVLITIVPLYRQLNVLVGANTVAYAAIALIAISALISLLFSTSQTRGALLTASLMLLILTLLCAWWFVYFGLKKVPKSFVNLFLLSGVVFAALALLQLAWGTFAGGTGGFLCKGCTSAVFGFPRVNVTAAEPLFFANSLLPVLMASFYLSLKKHKFAYLALFSTALAIGLTFSRGAYLAASFGILAIAALSYIYKFASFKKIVKAGLVVLAAGALSVTFLVASATVKYYSTTPNIAYNTFVSAIDHLSLGIINLPQKTAPAANNNDPTDDFVSPGLIEASANERTGSASLALQAWRDNAKNFFLGTGMGSLGPYVVANINPTAPSNLTVYIFYILFLAELGIVGLLALVTLLTNIIYKAYKKSSKGGLYIFTLAVVLAFATQYFFFGSYINVVYIWLWLGIALGILSNNKLTFQGIINKESKKNEE
jgi:hypothetical protein